MGWSPAIQLEQGLAGHGSWAEFQKDMIRREPESVAGSSVNDSVAIVTHNLSAGGGTGAMTAFLHNAFLSQGRHVDVFSLASSSSDTESVSVARLLTFERPRTAQGRWQGIDYLHVGCVAREFEPARYLPSTKLKKLLSPYSLVVVVAGTAQWYCRVEWATPSILWVATTVAGDRASRWAGASGRRRLLNLTTSGTINWMERRALAKAPNIYTLSPYAAEAIGKLSGRNDIVIAPCGVDTEFFRPSNANQQYLFAAARFSDPRKAFTNLIHAYSRFRLASGSQALPLVLAGWSPTPRDESLVHSLGLSHHVSFAGVVSREHLQSLLAHAAAFVVSSDEEGLCIAALEAMAAGVPVVSTRCGGTEHFVRPGETGFLVPTGNPTELGDALAEVVVNGPLRAKMRTACRTLIEREFSLQVAAASFGVKPPAPY